MLSKNSVKLIKSLADKRSRDSEGLFVAEGVKSVEAFLDSSLECVSLYATQDWIDSQPVNRLERASRIEAVSESELGRISFLKTPNKALAVVRKPEKTEAPIPEEGQLFLMLDSVQDPGNVGTIIRLANWFGIDAIVCSMETADAYGPKTVQSTMGSLANLKVHYTDLPDYLSKVKSQKPLIRIQGTLLDGDDIYRKPPHPSGIIVMGNESNGISPEVREMLTDRLFIPSYSRLNTGLESLNVSIATAIICAELRRLTL